MTRSGKIFFAAFPDGSNRKFSTVESLQYFSPPDPLIEQYRLSGPLPTEDRARLLAIDAGDSQPADLLIRSLDETKEFAAVDIICDRLQRLGCELDFFLLIKHAKALRKLKKSSQAIAVSSKAYWLAKCSTECSMALTVRAAARVDVGLTGKAEDDCYDALRENPDAFQPYRVLGRMHVARGEYSSADECFRNAMIRDPEKRDEMVGAYTRQVERCVQKGQKSEIGQIRAHIQKHWPAEIARRALREIDLIVGRQGA